MTKINKLGKSTFVIAILSFILVAVLAFGGTYAYFSASSNVAKADITLGHLRISTDAAFSSTSLNSDAMIVVPNQTILDSASDAATGNTSSGKMTVSVDSNINYFIRAHFDYEVKVVNTIVIPDDPEQDGDQSQTLSCANGECSCTDKSLKEVLIITPGVVETGAGWIAGVTEDMDAEVLGTGWYYYNTMWAPKNTAVAGATENVREHTFSITARVNPKVGQVESEHFMDAVITIKVEFEVIQADYILGDGAAAATPDHQYTAQELHDAWAKAYTAFAETPDGKPTV